ncbi:hypothetical protein [Celerinatantimonas sp. YJH-8]|uniref:hypothetical protein n=1 Tax=Celerinatantimonas sp. YJH-8 TaxID=3228714 RepID=UPI0038C806AA
MMIVMILIMLLSVLAASLLLDVHVQLQSVQHYRRSIQSWQALENVIAAVAQPSTVFEVRELTPYQSDISLAMIPQCYARCATSQQSCWLWRILVRDEQYRYISVGIVQPALTQFTIPECHFRQFRTTRNRLVWLFKGQDQ